MKVPRNGKIRNARTKVSSSSIHVDAGKETEEELKEKRKNER